MINVNPNSYAAIVQKITDMVRDLNADSERGRMLVEDTYKGLTQSIVPLHFVRDFITESSRDYYNGDASLKAATALMEKLLVSHNSLNYQIGVAREEHIIELTKMGITDPFESLKSIENEFHQPDTVVKINLEQGLYDTLHSEYLKKIKEQLDIKTENDELAQNGYQAVVNNVASAIYNTKAETKKGANLLKTTFQALMESETPMLVVKEFITNAQELDDVDATIGELMKTIKKHIHGNDLNYIINLCKEEHFANLNRSGHPDVKSTIADIEKLLQLPGNQIAELIKKGAFDKLDSKLLNETKVSLDMYVDETEDVAKDLNENYYESPKGFQSYTPIGFMVDDKKHGKVMLVECCVLSYNQEHNMFNQVEGFSPTYSQQHLLKAIQETSFNPATDEYIVNIQNTGIDEDFEMSLDTTLGEVYIQQEKVASEDVRLMLAQKIAELQAAGHVIEPLVTQVDNFLALVENKDSLVRFDTLNSVMYNGNKIVLNEKQILQEGSQPVQRLFESYTAMVNESSKQLGVDISELYKPCLDGELGVATQRAMEKEKLISEQKNLNAEITKLEALLKVAEPNSPAEERLTREIYQARKKLDKVLQDLAMYV